MLSFLFDELPLVQNKRKSEEIKEERKENKNKKRVKKNKKKGQIR